MQDDYPAGQSSERGGGHEKTSTVIRYYDIRPGCHTPGPWELWWAGQAMAQGRHPVGMKTPVRGSVQGLV
jgi:hypothetical protein